jgi:hypothetical protein
MVRWKLETCGNLMNSNEIGKLQMINKNWNKKT